MDIFRIGICRKCRELIKTGQGEGDNTKQDQLESTSIQERFQEITLVGYAVPSYNWWTFYLVLSHMKVTCNF